MPGDGWSTARLIEARERYYRERGYEDGYEGRPKVMRHPIYLRHYAIGASEWTREQKVELADWEAAHRG